MPEFLTLLSPKEALTRWLPAFGEALGESEEIDSTFALGRVTSKPVVAHHPLPEFPRSTMDGYAVRAVDTYGASDNLPAYFTLAGEVPMGGQPIFTLKPGQAALIHTGGMLPEHADAVVMLEYTQSAQMYEVEILRAVAPAENVIRVGEDVQTGQIVIPAGIRLRPAEIGGLAAFGIQKIRVARQPRIAIISSGDEVVPIEATPLPGQVRDINSYTLSALIHEKGGLPLRYGIMPDDAGALRKELDRALHESDAVIITAGSSASIRDLTAQVIQDSGSPGVLVHGVNVRPGKPTILAVCDHKPVVGLPGNPVSALLIAGIFVTPMLERLLGLQRPSLQAQVTARLSLNIPSQAGREDWIPVTLSGGPDDFLAHPIFFKSNLIFNLVKADGLLYIPADATGLTAGEIGRIYLL